MSTSEDPIQSAGQLKNKSTLKTTFNPVKEVKGDQRSQAIQWTSAILDTAVKGLGKGKRLVANPFYENNVKLLKPDLVFVRTAWEVAEWEHCANDIFYFIETYAKTMTPLGIRNITLRDYQRRYLQLPFLRFSMHWEIRWNPWYSWFFPLYWILSWIFILWLLCIWAWQVQPGPPWSLREFRQSFLLYF